MARLIPKLDLSDISNDSERKIAEALVQQLPDSNIVIHGFNWTARNKRGKIVEGECDCIVLDPEYGMLFIEVKGGIIKFLPEENEWVRVSYQAESDLPIKDPFGQVERNMYKIVNYIKQNYGDDSFPCTFGFAVAFPDGQFQGQPPASAQREQIFDANTLNDLTTAVRRVLTSFSRGSRPKMDKQTFSRLKNALLPKYEIVPILCQSIEVQERMLYRATQDQQRILSVLAQQKFAAIEGGAGTGKTLLAVAKAQQLAEAGLRTLLVCYNRALKDWLVDTLTGEFEDLLSVQTYHNLVTELCEQTNVMFIDKENPPTQEMWDDVAPERLMDACDLLTTDEKFDAVIVDEGQDFKNLWWTSLESVFRDPENKSAYYIFFDTRQNLFVKDEFELPPELPPPFSLTTNCRNTTSIAEHCASIIDEEVETRSSSPTGIPPEVHDSADWATGFRAAENLVQKLCRKDGDALEPSQITILTPGYAKREWPERFRRFEVTDDMEKWRNNEAVLIASLHQFKGLESDAVVLLTPTLPDIHGRYHIENYVARSRAKHVLHVIYVEQS